MRIRNLILTASAATAALVTLPACDNIDPADRYIPVEKVHAAKVVLIEKFTGLGCINCPAGDEMIHTLQQTYPDAIVAVSMHPEPGIAQFNRKMGDFDLRSKEAEPYFQYYQVKSMPYATFDGVGNELSSSPAKWPTIVEPLLKETSPLTITAETEYDAATRNVTVNYAVEFVDPVMQPLSVLCWVIENDLIGPQRNPSEVVKEYHHNHVFRTVANGTWGTSISDAATAAGVKVEGTCSVKLDESWVAENCQVVVFAFNTSSKEVTQTTLTDVIKAAADE